MPKSTFRADFQSLDEIRRFVAESARQAGFSEKEIYSIQLAADEASANIIEHAYGGEGNGEIAIDCLWSGDAFEIVIRDWGKSFDPARVPEPNLTDDLSRRKIGGLGMYLMRRLMDEVDYRSTPDAGNTLTMTKRKGVDT
ncbi:MAG: ATP-binding protein [Chloroflexota bacterium]